MPTIEYRFQSSGTADVVRSARSVTDTVLGQTLAFRRLSTEATSAYRDIATAARSAQRAIAGSATSGAAVQRRAARGAVADAERDAAKRIAIANRAANATARSEERARRHVAGIRDRYFRDEQRREEKEERARLRRSERLERERVQRIGSIRESAMGGLGSLGMAAGAAGLALGAAGTALVAQRRMRLEDTAARLVGNARLAGQTPPSREAVLDRLQAAAVAVPGIAADAIGGAAIEFQGKTGQIASGEMLKVFGNVAQASGSEVVDIASAAGSLRNQLGISSPREMGDALAMLAGQGAQGEFELKDSAALMNRMASAANGAQLGKGVGAVRELGALSQLAIKSAGTPERAATGMEAMLRQISANSPMLKKKFGVEVFSDKDKTQFRSITGEILPEIMAATKGSDPALRQIFGDEGMTGIRELQRAFVEAKNETGSVEAGLAAMDAALSQARGATLTYSDIVAIAAETQTTTTNKTAAAWERFSTKVDPAVAAFLDALTSAADVISELFPSDNNKFENVREAGQRVADLDARIAAEEKMGGDTSALKLQRKAAAAEEALAKTSLMAPVSSQSMTEDDFIAQFTAAGRGGVLTPYDRVLAGDAANLAFETAGVPVDDLGSLARGEATLRRDLINTTANQDQRDLLQRYMDQLTAERLGVQGPTGAATGGQDPAVAHAAELSKALMDFMTASIQAKQAQEQLSENATKAAEALGKIKPPGAKGNPIGT